MGERVRTFIAIELDPEARAFVASQQERLRGAGPPSARSRSADSDVRWVRPDLIHLTLAFLGNVAAESLGEGAAAVREAAGAAAPFTMRLEGAGQFPPHGAPRIVWLGVAEPTGALGRLQAAVAAATAPWAEKVEDRAYTPHLTLGRAKGGGDGGRLGEALAAMASDEGPTQDVSEVVVFRSDLDREGPTYAVMARVPLTAKDAGGD